METNDQAKPAAPAPVNSPLATQRTSRRLHVPTLILLAAGFATVSAAFVVYSLSGPDSESTPSVKEVPKGLEWSMEEVFPNWPKGEKPEFVIVLTGQTYGYLQPCGCSEPMKGGLERRFNFIEGFKAHGIEAIPLDLGDVTPQVSEDHKLLHSQALLKYKTAMRAMKAMGYRTVGLGKEDFSIGLLEALAEYSLQPGNEQPSLLGANLLGYLTQSGNGKSILSPKKDSFPDAQGTNSAVRDWELIQTKNKLSVGVIGIVGDAIISDVKKIDSKIAFAPNSAKVVFDSLKEMSSLKNPPKLNVLLYSGPLERAEKAAKAFPQFQIVVCRSEEAEPPAKPVVITDPKNPELDSLLIRVGHKGQNVGVVGVFKKAKGGFELKYQLVTMTPTFETPVGKEEKNSALKELQNYSDEVHKRGYLTLNRKGPHPLQVSNPKAQYLGSQTCMACHDAIAGGDCGAVFGKSKHANAYAALSQAKKPYQRQFDGECIRCHVVGYDYNTGFIDALKTPQLLNVGCESCHGPGSEHAANPMNKTLSLELSPWKINAGDKMPSVEKIKDFLEEKDQAKKQAILTPQEHKTLLRIDRTCQTCHNAENDPHFKIEVFWPKIVHTLKKANVGNGNPKAVDPKENGPAITIPIDNGPAILPPK